MTYSRTPQPYYMPGSYAFDNTRWCSDCISVSLTSFAPPSTNLGAFYHYQPTMSIGIMDYFFSLSTTWFQGSMNPCLLSVHDYCSEHSKGQTARHFPHPYRKWIKWSTSDILQIWCMYYFTGYDQMILLYVSSPDSSLYSLWNTKNRRPAPITREYKNGEKPDFTLKIQLSAALEPMGLEPMTSRVWGERSSQLSYDSLYVTEALRTLKRKPAIVLMTGIVPRRVELLFPPWEGGVLTTWPRNHAFSKLHKYITGFR